MEMRYPFKTTTMPAIATSGVLVAIAVPAPNQFTLQTNAAQLIFYNPDLVETLYIRAYNPIADVAGVDINTCLPVTPQGYLTLSLGTRTESGNSDCLWSYHRSSKLQFHHNRNLQHRRIICLKNWLGK